MSWICNGKWGTFWTVFFVLTVLLGVTAEAQKKTSQAIRIKSDRMEARDETGTVVFSGHVVAIKGNVTINADRLEVVYEKYEEKAAAGEEKKKKRRIKKIVASGHVRILQEKRMGTGEKAIYDKMEEKIVLMGSAQVWEGQNRIKGERIIFYLNEERSVVESDENGKVEAVVFEE